MHRVARPAVCVLIEEEPLPIAHGNYSDEPPKAMLIEKYNADVPLPNLPHMIASECPKMDALGNDPCGAHYRDL